MTSKLLVGTAPDRDPGSRSVAPSALVVPIVAVPAPTGVASCAEGPEPLNVWEQECGHVLGHLVAGGTALFVAFTVGTRTRTATTLGRRNGGSGRVGARS